MRDKAIATVVAILLAATAFVANNATPSVEVPADAISVAGADG